MYKVLLILPDTGLETDHEFEWITRTYHTETLRGIVTPATVFDHITGRKFDIIHFGSHGSSNGIELSNGTLLSMFDVERIARQVGAQLVYLNSCSSARLAQFAVDQGVPAVIASTGEIQDVQAWSIATGFYQALLDAGDFYTAFEKAKPRDGTLSFYSDGQVISKQIRPLMDRMTLLEASLQNSQNQTQKFFYGMVGTWIFIVAELAFRFF